MKTGSTFPRFREEIPMFRRLPTFQSLTLATAVGLFALSSVLLAQPPGTGTDNPGVKIKNTQEENLKLFKRFADEALRLAQKWEKSDSPDDRERAKTSAALKLVDEKNVENLFKELVKGLGNPNPNSTEFNSIFGKDAKLILALQEILSTLDTEDEAKRIRDEIAKIKAAMEEIKRLKREQENVAGRTNNPRSDSKSIAKQQGELAKDTQKVADQLGGKDSKGAPNSGNPKSPDEKSAPKPEDKPGASSPEAKPDTPDSKSDPKAGDGAGSPMSGDPKPTPPGGMNAGDSKDPPKDGNNAGGDPKPSGEPKTPTDPKAGGDPKPMSGDSKAQGEGKGDPKPSAGQPGGDGKPMTGQSGMPSSGSPSASKPSSGSPSSGSPSSGTPSSGQPNPNAPAQENVQQAVPNQQGAQEDIEANKRDDAGKKQDEAIQALERALKELEKRLKQLREKELAKLLANLEERVGRMLRMQIEVYEATKTIDKGVQKNKNQKTTADIQKSQSEADKELGIIAEAEKALKLMEGEGSAVVFAGVLREVKGDMEAVQRRLNEGRVEKQTQDIEEDIIEQLTMMKEALKKAKQDLENSQNKPSDPKEPGKPNQKLIDLLNELKLIKSLQEQVNKRTIGHSKQDPGEQAKDPLIQAELKQLSDRQKVLQDMLHKIATEANQ